MLKKNFLAYKSMRDDLNRYRGEQRFGSLFPRQYRDRKEYLP